MSVEVTKKTTKPTEDASYVFQVARDSAGRAVMNNKGNDAFTTPALTAHAIYCIAQGLDALSTGLRATYIKLEQVEQLIRRSTK